jgi:hypothetical protein
MCLLAAAARASLRLLMRQVLVYGIGISLVFLPVAAGAWAAGAIPGFVHDILSFPSGNYARMRALPWPAPGLSLSSLPPLIVYVPFLTAAAGLYWLVSNKLNGREIDGRARLGIALLSMVLVFSLKGIVRVSFPHSVLAIVPALILLVYLVSRNLGTGLRMLSLAVFGVASLLIAANVLSWLRLEAQRDFGTLLPSQVVGGPAAAESSTECATQPELGLGIVDRDTADALCYIISHTRSGERIFIGAGRHDKVFANKITLYYFSDRRPATRWYHLEPGLQTDLEIQKSVVGDLVRNKVRLIALDSQFDDVNESNDSARSSNVCLLDRFIKSRYREVARFGSIKILNRREADIVPQRLPVPCKLPIVRERVEAAPAGA